MIDVKKIKLKDFEIGGDKLTILAGPCAIESYECMATVAEKLKAVCEKLGINYVFKSSYDAKETYFELTEEFKQDRDAFASYATHVLRMIISAK